MASADQSSGATAPNREYLDWMCISIVKQAETDSTCEYRYSSDVYGPNPHNPKRSMVVRQVSGLLRIDKATGDIEVLEPMPGDDHNWVAVRAAGKVYGHWTRGEYPEATLFACG